MRRGLLVCLSGMESSGKSTQLERLAEESPAHGLTPITIWTRPGYTRNLEALKRRLTLLRGRGRSGASDRPPRPYPRRAETFGRSSARQLWLTLALVDLIWIYGVEIRYRRARGQTVLCDRYLGDCLVDFRINFPDDRVERKLLGRLLVGIAPRPDLALFLMIPVAESVRRSEQRERRFREKTSVLERRLAEYGSVVKELGWQVLDGMMSAEAVSIRIRSHVADAVGSSREARAEPGES